MRSIARKAASSERFRIPEDSVPWTAIQTPSVVAASWQAAGRRVRACGHLEYRPQTRLRQKPGNEEFLRETPGRPSQPTQLFLRTPGRTVLDASTGKKTYARSAVASVADRPCRLLGRFGTLGKNGRIDRSLQETRRDCFACRSCLRTVGCKSVLALRPLPVARWRRRTCRGALPSCPSW